MDRIHAEYSGKLIGYTLNIAGKWIGYTERLGCGGCWLVLVAAVGVTPRIVQVDHSGQGSIIPELPKKSSLEKRLGAMQQVFSHRISMRALLA